MPHGFSAKKALFSGKTELQMHERVSHSTASSSYGCMPEGMFSKHTKVARNIWLARDPTKAFIIRIVDKNI
jgi:hypothetical protein